MSKIPEVPKSMRTCENCDQGQDADEAYCREDGCDGLDWTECFSDFRARAEAIIADLKKRVVASDHEVLQTLGKALGYAPTFPEASRMDDGQVNVGEHVPTTIAQATATRIAVLTAEGDDLQKIADAHVTVFDEMGTALGMTCDALPNGHFYAGGVLDETKRVRQQLADCRGRLALLQEAIEDRGCEHGVIVKDACVKCHDKCPMGRARTSDAGKTEANVIAAALDDFHPDALGDIAHDLDMTTGAEGHEDAILAYLKTLSTAEAVACLNGDAR